MSSASDLQGTVMPNVSNQGDSVIKVKSLPYDACQLDVLHFFENFRIRPNGVQLVIQGNNKPSGEVSTQQQSCNLYVQDSDRWTDSVQKALVLNMEMLH